MEKEAEAMFRKCGSKAAIRQMAEDKPEVQTSRKESVEPTQSLVRNRFLRLKLKKEPLQAADAISSSRR